MKLRHLAMLSVAALAATVQSVSATSIGYFTSGSFASNGLAVQSFTNGANTVTVSFIPQALTFVDAPPATGVDLGDFTVTASASSPLAVVADTFNLTVTQVSPSGGGNVFVGTLSGQIDFDSGLISVAFVPGAFSIGPVTYTMNNNPMILNAPIGGSVNDIRATVNAVVPLPAAAWGGMALLGVLGAAKAVRRRAMK